jgi:hypothetical protein
VTITRIKSRHAVAPAGGRGARCLRRATEHELRQFIAAASRPPRGRNVGARYDSNLPAVMATAPRHYCDADERGFSEISRELRCPDR